MTQRPHHYRTASIVVLALTIFAGVVGPVSADDEPNIFTLEKVFRLGCDDGEDCPKAFFLGHSGGFLGVELTNLNPELRRHFGVAADAGVLVGGIVEDSPAEHAGLQVGDIITAIDGEPMASSGAVGRAVRNLDTAGPLDIDLYRDGELLTVRADIEVRERKSFDLGTFMSDRGVEISNAIAGINWQELAESSQHLSQEAVREALGSLDNVFTEERLEGFLEQMESFDHDAFAERMEMLRERMEELEKRLEERFEENNTP